MKTNLNIDLFSFVLVVCPPEHHLPEGSECGELHHGKVHLCDADGQCQERAVECTKADDCQNGPACALRACNNGVCDYSQPRNAGVQCRAKVGPCDVAEMCDGQVRMFLFVLFVDGFVLICFVFFLVGFVSS